MSRKVKLKKGTDLLVLKGKIREEGTTYVKLASELGVSVATFSDKVNGSSKREFKSSEIMKLCKLLNIELCNAHKYFFNC